MKSHEFLREHHAIAVQAVEKAGISYAKGCIAGFFLWIDLSKRLDSKVVAEGGWAAEQDLSRRLKQAGLEMYSGHAYHNEIPGWYRVIFTVDRETLEEGLSRIVEFY